MNERDVWSALSAIDDPELGVGIVDLGLVYSVKIEPHRVQVAMTMTSPACPVGPYLVDEAAAAIRAIAPPDTVVDVDLVWEPPWSPERMTERARRTLGS